MILIVASNNDPASLNIKKQILSHYHFRETRETYQENMIYTNNLDGKDIELITLNQESVYSQDLTTFFKQPELVIFVSRHSSASGTPTLSVHTPGNLGQAEFGGKTKNVSISPANTMREALKEMARLKDELRLDYEVSYEATHHGPSLNVPAFFAELGSTQIQWNDLLAAEAVAEAVMAAISKFGIFQAEAVLGIGGPHYNPKFTKMALQNEVAFGHIIPKHSLSETNTDMIQQCIKKTQERVDQAVLDWKGIKADDKPRVMKILNETSLHVQKV